MFNAEDFETFKGLNREKNIPEESMVKLSVSVM